MAVAMAKLGARISGKGQAGMYLMGGGEVDGHGAPLCRGQAGPANGRRRDAAVWPNPGASSVGG